MAEILQIDVLTSVFKLLSDETRLRILSLLRESELAVGELQKILGIGQSTLSTQLGLLKEQDLVASRKEGQKVLYRIPGNSQDDPKLQITINALQSAPAAKWYARDMRGFKKVLEERGERSREFFNSQAVQNLPSPGQSWRALCHGLIRLIHGQRIVDLGCGNGRLSILLAQSGNNVTGIDSSEEQIRLALRNIPKASKASQGQSRSRTGPPLPIFLHATMEATGLSANCADIVIVSQSLHHAAKPKEAIAENRTMNGLSGQF